MIKKYLSLRRAESLKAINPVSRIALARSLANEMTIVRNRSRVQDFFFITIISRDHAFPIDRAPEFNAKALRRWLKNIIGRADFVGFWEAAYFYRSPFLEAGLKPHIVWHVHLIVWNVEEEAVRATRDRVNIAENAFVPGRPAFHYRRLSWGQALGRVFYMSKGCLSEYTAYPRAMDVFDPETGEVTTVPSTTWQSRKRPIRPGSLAKITNAFGLLPLKSLFVAGGIGKDVKRRAVKASRRSLKEERLLREQAIREAVLGRD
ncbi:hypothetical protein ELG64_01125 [Rhizobium leguminosarum]|uniref:hypothetical protein n=1 Tax=Rhizobium leguminosarum TaxID=384 RepID=UPI00102F6659|nr:hypothetical protein [Rhizobium leguminosarum]TBH22205.1 hypothetical protein ELG64_01125 [Rhizobium leguminosarum]